MFTLNDDEIDLLVSQIVIPSKKHLGGTLPFAFTEIGVAMLSSVLKSQRAKEMNIAIMRSFVYLRRMVLNHAELNLEIELIRKKVDSQDKNIELVFHYLDELSEEKNVIQPERKRIGYKITEKS